MLDSSTKTRWDVHAFQVVLALAAITLNHAASFHIWQPAMMKHIKSSIIYITSKLEDVICKQMTSLQKQKWWRLLSAAVRPAIMERSSDWRLFQYLEGLSFQTKASYIEKLETEDQQMGDQYLIKEWRYRQENSQYRAKYLPAVRNLSRLCTWSIFHSFLLLIWSVLTLTHATDVRKSFSFNTCQYKYLITS